MTNFIILIPPSEGKEHGGSGKPLTKPSMAASAMITKLQQFKGDHNKLLGVKGTALEQAITANQNILSGPTMPAISRYTGVVFKALDYPGLSKVGQKYCHAHIRIVSGLFGLLKPQDLIPDYKLKIEKLDAQKYWKPLIRKQLKGHYIIDLLPQAHAKAVDYAGGIRIDFKIIKSGRTKPAGHNGKHIKGRFVRWLCENNIADPKHFKKFSEDGFTWDGQNFIKETS